MDIKKKENHNKENTNGNNGVELQQSFIFITPKSNNPKTKSENKLLNSKKSSKINEDRAKSAQFLNEIKLKIDNGMLEKSDRSSSSEESDSDDDSYISSTKKSKFLICCYDNKLKLNNSLDPNEREKFKNNLNNYRLRNRILTIIVIFIILSALGYLGYFIKNFRYKYQFLTELDKKIVHEYPVKYANFEVKFKDLFPIGSDGYYNMDHDLVKKIIRKEIDVNLEDKKFESLRNFVEFKWETLVEVFREKILTSNCSFNGENIGFGELFGVYSEAFDKLSTDQIIKVLHNESVLIGQRIQNEVKFYVERNFIEVKIEKNQRIVSSLPKEEEKGKLNEPTGSVRFKQSKSKRFSRSLESNESEEQNETNLSEKVINFDQIIQNSIKNHKLLILSDKLGSGKTTAFKMLALKIKQKFPSSWISYINLRKFTKFTNRRGKVKSVESFLENIFNDSCYSSAPVEADKPQKSHITDHIDVISDAFSIEASFSQKKIVKRDLNNPELLATKASNFKNSSKLSNYTKVIPSNFEREILKLAYKKNKTVIFWDGFDEISPTYSQFMINVIKEISFKTDNIQFVSANSENLNIFLSQLDVDELQEGLIYKFRPFDDSDQEIFIKNQLNFKDWNFSDQFEGKLMKNDRNSKSFNFEILKTKLLGDNFKFQSNFNDFIDIKSPLMLQMLAEVVINEEQRSSGKNHGSNLENKLKIPKTINLYELFDNFFQIKLTNWAEIIQLKNHKNPRESQTDFKTQFFLKNSTIKQSLIKIIQIFAFRYEMAILSSPIHLRMLNLDTFKNLIIDFGQSSNKLNPNYNLFARFDQKLINSNIINEETLELGFISQQFDRSLQLSHRIFTDFILAQYLIENGYNFDGCVDIEEARLRFDLLLHFIRSYGHNDSLVVLFVEEYLRLEADKQKVVEKNDKDSTNDSKIKDFELNEQSFVNKSESFGIFKTSDSVDIEQNLNNSQNILKISCDSNKTNSIIPKIKFKKIFSELLSFNKSQTINESSTILKFSINSTLCDLIDELNSSLNDTDWSEFLISPDSFVILAEYFYNDSQDIEDLNCDSNQIEDFWSKVENSSEESQSGFFENVILRYFDSKIDINLLNFLSNKTENFLSSQNISKLINQRNIFHKSAENIDNFEVMWEFYVKHEANHEERKKVLLKSDCCWVWDGIADHSDLVLQNQDEFRFFNSQLSLSEFIDSNHPQNSSESSKKSLNQVQFNLTGSIPFYFESTQFKIIHIALLNSKTIQSVDTIMNIYGQYFNESEMMEIMTSSSDFLLYFASFSDPEVCEEFSVFLQALFLFNEQELQNFLNRKNEKIPLNLINYISLYNTDQTCAKMLYNTPNAIKQFKDNFRSENVAMGNSGFYLTSGKKLTPAEIISRFKNSPQNSTPKGDWSKLDKNLVKSLT